MQPMQCFFNCDRKNLMTNVDVHSISIEATKRHNLYCNHRNAPFTRRVSSQALISHITLDTLRHLAMPPRSPGVARGKKYCYGHGKKVYLGLKVSYEQQKWPLPSHRPPLIPFNFSSSLFLTSTQHTSPRRKSPACELTGLSRRI